MEKFAESMSNACEAINKRHYMDDYLEGLSTEEETVKRIFEVHKVHGRGGFHICNWICSFNAVTEHGTNSRIIKS